MPDGPTTILIEGGYGGDNLGDESLLHVTTAMVRRAIDEPEILVASVQPERIRELHDVEGFETRSPGAILRLLLSLRPGEVAGTLRRLRGVDVYMLGGGSLLNDHKGYRYLTRCLAKLTFFKAAGARTLMIGVGVGPIETRRGRWLLRRISALTDFIQTRDAASVRELEAAGRRDRLEQGVDLAFGLGRCREAAGAASATGDPTRLEAGLSLRPFPPVRGVRTDRQNAALREAISSALEVLADERDMRVHPLVFCGGGDGTNDRTILEALRERSPGLAYACPGTTILDRGVSLDAVMRHTLDRMSRLHMVLGMRFHSLVYAATVGVPFVALAYDRKVTELCVQLGQADFLIDVMGDISVDRLSAEVVRKTRRLLSEREEAAERLRERRGHLADHFREGAEAICCALRGA